MRRLLLLPVLALVAIATMAIAPATTFAIIRAYGYGGALETGDLLLVVQYDIDYTSYPTELAGEAYIGSYYDTSAALDRRSATPYYYVNNGYGQGVLSVYLSAAAVTSYGITYGDADSARLTGNPALFASPQVVTTLIEWRTSTTVSTTLAADIRVIAGDLEGRSEWAAQDLIVDGLVLQTAGADYFQAAVPNLRTMAPTLFSGSITNPTFEERTHGTSYATQLDNYFAGSAFASSWTNAANWLNVPERALTTSVFVMLALAIGSFVAIKSGSAALSLPVAAVVLIAGTLVGWVALQFMAIMGFFGLLVVAWKLWLQRAT